MFNCYIYIYITLLPPFSGDLHNNTKFWNNEDNKLHPIIALMMNEPCEIIQKYYLQYIYIERIQTIE